MKKSTKRRGLGMLYNIKPIAVVSNSRTMIEDDNWGDVISTIELTKGMHESSLKRIDDFSHLEIIFYFNKVAAEKIQYEARHPRNNTDYPEVGIFAQRGKNRPNKIGVTVVELLELKDRTIIVKGLDAIDGTPIIDIKPVMKEFLPKGEIKQPQWATDLMKNYWD